MPLHRIGSEFDDSDHNRVDAGGESARLHSHDGRNVGCGDDRCGALPAARQSAHAGDHPLRGAAKRHTEGETNTTAALVSTCVGRAGQGGRRVCAAEWRVNLRLTLRRMESTGCQTSTDTAPATAPARSSRLCETERTHERASGEGIVKDSG